MQRLYQEDQIAFVKDGAEIARICEMLTDDTVEIALFGAFSSELANDLFDELMALITVGKGIEMNLGGVTHISPTVNRIFLEIEKKLEVSGKIMRMTHVPELIYREFRRNGMYELFEMELEK